MICVWDNPYCEVYRISAEHEIIDPTSTMTAVPLSYFRMPLVLLSVIAVLCVATAVDPPSGRFNWLLEVGPGLIGIAVLIALYRRFPMSHLVYFFVFLHMLILIYGGYYTYAETPLGNWAKEVFSLSRNHYDRVGHVALGVFPAFIIREGLLRRTPLQRGRWLYFIVISIGLAVAAFWELLEWWVTLIVASDVGIAFLGSQGDVWDAQWDMFLALIGAMIALPILSPMHDRSMARLFKAQSRINTSNDSS
jgi:putative membrane protein